MSRPFVLRHGMRCVFGNCRRRARKVVVVALINFGRVEYRPGCKRCAEIFGPFYNANVVDIDDALAAVAA